MDPSDVMVPADVPDELIDTYVENYLNATAGTGSMNLFACDQKIEHLNDDFYGEASHSAPTTLHTCSKSVTSRSQKVRSACSPVNSASSHSTLEMHLTFHIWSS